MYLYNNTEQYDTLPERITLPDGMTRTSLHELSKAEQESLGLVEYTDATPAYDGYLQELSGSVTFDHESKTFVRAVANKNPDIIKQGLINAIQSYLDTEAQAHFYDGILSLCSYATSVNPKFGPEGQAGVIWRDACWTIGYTIMAEVQAQTRAIPTIEELLAEMPVMVWP